MLSRNVNNKKCPSKLEFFNEKKMRKIPMIFDEENYIEHQILTPSHYTNSQNSIILFKYVHLLAKIFLILYPSLEILTTHITIT